MKTILFFLCLFFAFSCSLFQAKKPWADFETPSPSKNEAIGSSSAGCLAGALRLNEDEKSFVLMRPSRKRYWGHAELLEFIKRLALKVNTDLGSLLLVGDMAQPRGGLLPGSHRSHQSGLDVDLWYELFSKLPQDFSREDFSASSMVKNKKAFGSKQEALIRLIAHDPQVERVFVHPEIKKRLCKSYKNEKWLRTVRPWWGHDDHLHVRLVCPTSEKNCVAGPALPSDSGCGAELAWWFSDEAKQKGSAPSAPLEDKSPPACDEVRSAK